MSACFGKRSATRPIEALTHFDSFNSRSFDDHLDIALTGQANSATLAEIGRIAPGLMHGA